MADTITKPAVISMPFCNSGDKNTIPAAATGTNLASLQEGFPVITSTPLKNGGIPPERRDFNGIANLMSQFYYAFQNGWWPSFDSDVSTAIGGYAAGAVLWYETGRFFVMSLKNNNTDNFVSDPTKIDGVSWQQISRPVQTLVTDLTSTSITLANAAANTIYQYGTLTNLTITANDTSKLETMIYFTAGNSITVNLPQTLKTIGYVGFFPNTEYILSIQDNILVVGEVNN